MSSRYSLIGALVLAIGLAGCQQQPQEQTALPVDINQVKADLETLSQARIFFAHQSVGRNLLKGVAMLSEETGVALRVEEVGGGAPSPGPGLFHANVGENGHADSKISAFTSDVSAAGATPYDVALLKFCYSDIGGDSQDKSPQKLFERYEQAVSGLKQQQPGLTVLQVTIPLRAQSPGRKAALKRMLGMSVDSDADNILRGEYNALIREKSGQPGLFDVARLEATRADGSINSFKAQGREFEMLADEYTHDGGHLNDPTKRAFAASFLHTLAEAVRARPAAGPSGS